MAARHLRRLRGEDDPLASLPGAPGGGGSDGAEGKASLSSSSSSSDGSASPAGPTAARPFNPFALLTDDEEEGSDGASEDAAAPAPPPPPPPPLAASKKKARKKKQGGAAGDEVDAALRELGIEVKADPAPPARAEEEADDGRGGGGGGGDAPLLAVDARALRGDDETRRLFGDPAGRGGGRVGGAGGGPGAGVGPGVRRRAGGGPARAAPRLAPRRGALLGGRTPPGRAPGGGLSMVLLDPPATGPSTTTTTTTFSYVAGPLYEAGCAALESAQATHDPASVFAVLSSFPSHAGALLVGSDLCRLTAQHDEADALLDGALGALEAAAHPAFAAAAAGGTARLAGGGGEAYSPNRTLLAALARRTAAAARRGLPATAFATATLLLALDPAGDPTGARLAIDTYALRAGRAAWVAAAAAGGLTPSSSSEGGGGGGGGGGRSSTTSDLAALPNWAFSAGLAALRLGEADAAAKALTKAALVHPHAVVALAGRLATLRVTHPALGAALARPPFADADAPTGSASLDRLISLFVERQHALWRAPDALAALAAAATAAADTAAGSPVAAAAWAAARAAAFPPGEPDAYAHLQVSDFSDAAQVLPAEELAALQAEGRLGGGGGPGGGGGQAAGGDDDDDDARLVAAAAAAGGAGGRDVDALLARLGPVRALLGALAPWNDWGGGEGGAEEEEEEHEQEEG